MTKKQSIRVVAFALVICTIVVMLSKFFLPFSTDLMHISNRMSEYFSQDKNSIDVALVGTSGMDRYWISPKAYEEEGIVSFTVATNLMPAWCVLPVVKHIESRNENLKLLVVDMRPFVTSYSDKLSDFETRSRWIISTIPFTSPLKYELLDRTNDVIKACIKEPPKYDLSYIFTFIKYHSKWDDKGFSVEGSITKKTEFMGTFTHDTLSFLKKEITEKNCITKDKKALHPICQAYFDELIEYLKTRKYEVLFINTPHVLNETQAKRMNTVVSKLKKEGFKYLDVRLEKSNYDLNTDFYNSGHVNYYGADKFTSYFIEYLNKNYDLPDRRGDRRYSHWDGVYDRFLEYIHEHEEVQKK